MSTFVQVKACGDEIQGYGISVTLPSGSEKEYAALFVSRRDAELLCEKINRNCASIEHVFDVIEDALP